MKLAIPCLACVLLLAGCSRQVAIPPGEEDALPPNEKEAEAVPGVEVKLGQQLLLSLPDPFLTPGKFRCDPYVAAAARFQNVGRKAAIKALGVLARDERASGGQRAVVLCRMLFTKKAASEFRRPMLGAAVFLGGTDYPDWPMEPIEVIDGVPFLIVRGYELGGRAESSERYLSYCVTHCEWNGVTFASRTPPEKAKALDKLTGSAKWKRPLDADERDFLAEQIK